MRSTDVHMSTSHRTGLIEELDELYAELIAHAHKLAAAYLEEAATIHGSTRRQVQMLIQVKKHTPQSWGIYWAKNTAAPGTPAIPMTINKGARDNYPVGTFSPVKEPLKTLCRNYEKRLALIRAACRQNRSLRRTLEAHARQVTNALNYYR